jgi:hypothetical protein
LYRKVICGLWEDCSFKAYYAGDLLELVWLRSGGTYWFDNNRFDDHISDSPSSDSSSYRDLFGSVTHRKHLVGGNGLRCNYSLVDTEEVMIKCGLFSGARAWKFWDLNEIGFKFGNYFSKNFYIRELVLMCD